jgi:hypothetical protein
MNQRRMIVTAVPLVILMAFAVVGVVASRAADDDGNPTDDKPGLPFAVADPVRAAWDPHGAAKAKFTYEIELPKTDRAQSSELSRQKILLDGKSDVIIGISRSHAPDFGFLVNNESKAERILIDGLTVSEFTEYGGYVFGAKDWWIKNTVLHRGKHGSQHGLRIAYGQYVRISDTSIDTRNGSDKKSTLWVLDGDHIELRNVKLQGCSNIFSVDPANPDLADGKATNIVIADCWIDLMESQAWAHPLDFQPGTDNVVITNLHVRSPWLQPIGVWPSVDGVPAARNIRWKDIWVPAPGQPPDTPFDSLMWVKLRDDDFDRIIKHKGRTREEIIADGIGPLPDPPATGPALLENQ